MACSTPSNGICPADGRAEAEPKGPRKDSTRPPRGLLATCREGSPGSRRAGPHAGPRPGPVYPSRGHHPRQTSGEAVQLSILLLATDRPSAEALTTALARPGHGVTVVAEPSELYAQASGYSLVIVDQVPPPATVASVVEGLRANEATARIPVLAIAQADDLEARVEAVALRFQRSLSAVPATVTASAIGDPNARRVISVFSPKGGVGTTTIATNLALLAAERHPGATLLVDLDLSFGQVASHLNLEPKQGLLELVRDEAALREPDLFRTYTIHHPSGLQVITAPPAPGFASLVTAEHIELLLARAIEAYDVVIVDSGATLDDRMLAIFARSDTVVVPVVPEIPALNAVHLLLDQLNETGGMGRQTMFVLNNTFLRDLAKVILGKTAAVPGAVAAATPVPKKERRGLFGRR